MLIKARSHTSRFNNRPDIWQQPVPDIEIRRLAHGEETIYGMSLQIPGNEPQANFEDIRANSLAPLFHLIWKRGPLAPSSTSQAPAGQKRCAGSTQAAVVVTEGALLVVDKDYFRHFDLS
jgi:hypothetical protein